MAAPIKNLVFPTDFSEFSAAALPWARKFADDLGAEIHCVYVVEEPRIYTTLDMGAVALPTVGELEESARGRLDEFISEHLQNLETASEGTVLTGRAAEEIVTYARDIDAAMIVMTTHGYSGVKHALLGSTTEEVLRHAECPVLSVRVTADA